MFEVKVLLHDIIVNSLKVDSTVANKNRQSCYLNCLNQNIDSKETVSAIAETLKEICMLNSC